MRAGLGLVTGSPAQEKTGWELLAGKDVGASPRSRLSADGETQAMRSPWPQEPRIKLKSLFWKALTGLQVSGKATSSMTVSSGLTLV